MAQFTLSPRAQKSLKKISEYTQLEHGPQQRKSYLSMLRGQMRRVAESPRQGRVRDDIKLGYYSIRAGKHCIYYRLRDSHTEIIDVLHESMDPYRHL